MMTIIASLALCLAQAQEPASPEADLSPITLHIAGFS